MSRKCHNKNLDMQIFLNFFAENFKSSYIIYTNEQLNQKDCLDTNGLISGNFRVCPGHNIINQR